MDKKFLNKVVDQIVSETIVDYDKEEIHFPFLSRFPLARILYPHLPLPFPLPFFYEHCREVYGLNDDEIDYVWKEYRNIIIYKIKINWL